MVSTKSRQKPDSPQKQPAPSRMVLAVLSTLFCCLPGIVAIVYAARTNTCNEEKNYETAWENARIANIWSMVAMGFGAACLMIAAVLAAAILPQFARSESPHDRAAVKSLERLAECQQIHFEVHGMYAEYVEELDFEPEEDVLVEIKYGDEVSWRAVAQHYESDREMIWDSEEGGLQRQPLFRFPRSEGREEDDDT